jgi:hypothetical protein
VEELHEHSPELPIVLAPAPDTAHLSRATISLICHALATIGGCLFAQLTPRQGHINYNPSRPIAPAKIDLRGAAPAQIGSTFALGKD